MLYFVVHLYTKSQKNSLFDMYRIRNHEKKFLFDISNIRKCEKSFSSISALLSKRKHLVKKAPFSYHNKAQKKRAWRNWQTRQV